MIDLKDYEFWFVTGSQHLYGRETLDKVKEHSKKISKGIADAINMPVKIINVPVLTTPDSIINLCNEANSSKRCAGLIFWMHTFSPAKMWIAGLKVLKKPILHLHTQFNRDIPWENIDMEFMNLNQSAHGGREFGYIVSRMGICRKVLAGYWQEQNLLDKLIVWIRASCAYQDSHGLRIARFGDNMRDVAVTEGDKVEAQIKFGYSVNGYGLGDLVKSMNRITEAETDDLILLYEQQYKLSAELQRNGEKRNSLKEAAKIELGMRRFLEEGGFKGFTTTFENLYGLPQLPGLAVQRLMAEGYGFGAEGDWKTAALVRAMKVMASGLKGGTSFMEDYTYHLEKKKMMVLGAHMLEVCPSIAGGKPSLEIHPLSIGGKADPARLVFDTKTGNALNATIVDMGNRFRMIVNEVTVVEPPLKLKNLPVARALWIPKPDLSTAAAAWILAGGAHHTGFSQALISEHLEDFAEMAGIEFLLINDKTLLTDFKKEIRWNDAYYYLHR